MVVVEHPVDNESGVHDHYMHLAMEQAREAGRKGEVPIGALIVARNERGEMEILSQAHNLVETRHDASAHAELLAMQRAAKKQKNWRLINATLYSSLEPCPMCLAACQAFRVSSIVYGAPDMRLGAIETHMKMLDVPHPFHTIEDVVPRVQEAESAELLRDFFRQRRKKTKADPNPPTLRRSKLTSKIRSWLSIL